jgi:pilus assembly protein Flp/PilA
MRVTGALCAEQELPEGRALPVSSCRAMLRQPELNYLTYWNRSAPHWHGFCELSSRHAERIAPMKNTLINFWTDESGATAIEYGLIAAGIALAIISVVNGLGSKLNTKFGSISASLK